MTYKGEQGSIHLVITILIAVALLAGVGYVAWNAVSKHSQSSTTPVTASEAVITKSYCTPIEKICFDYPDGWQVALVTSHSPQSDGAVERVSIANKAGIKQLELTTGATGVGGTCGDDGAGSIARVLKTQPTKITGSYLANAETKDYFLPTVYAVSLISYNANDKTWTTRMELNNSKSIVPAGTIGYCDAGIGMINGKNATVGDTKGDIMFAEASTIEQKTYNTEAAAKAAVSSPDADQAYAILSSAHY
jgi:hypothetical protein